VVWLLRFWRRRSEFRGGACAAGMIWGKEEVWVGGLGGVWAFLRV